MNCPDCGAEMKPLFISSYCPRCSDEVGVPAGQPDGWSVWSPLCGDYFQEIVFLTREGAEHRRLSGQGVHKKFPDWVSRPVRTLRTRPPPQSVAGHLAHGLYQAHELELL